MAATSTLDHGMAGHWFLLPYVRHPPPHTHTWRRGGHTNCDVPSMGGSWSLAAAAALCKRLGSVWTVQLFRVGGTPYISATDMCTVQQLTTVLAFSWQYIRCRKYSAVVPVKLLNGPTWAVIAMLGHGHTYLCW
jgi:hypothetical protein